MKIDPDGDVWVTGKGFYILTHDCAYMFDLFVRMGVFSIEGDDFVYEVY